MSGQNNNNTPMRIKGKARSRKPGEKSLAVTMIVKNETGVILRCLESLYQHLDYWVIHDTGSTDGTQDMIKNFFKEKGIPGELHETPWKNFGYNRSRAIQDTQGKADYTLLCDADFILMVKDPNFKKKLSADGYLVKYDGHLDYRQNLLVSCKYKWAYYGVTHEYIHCPTAKNIISTDLIVFKHFADGGSRGEKFERDISLLKQGIKDEPKNSRYYFYLAQSYKDTGQYDEAISYYRKRVDFGGWGEEVYYSLYQLGMCKKRRGDSFWDFMGDLLRAYWYRPQRLEALHQLVNHCRMNGFPQIGYQVGKLAIHNNYPKDMLFIEKPVHDWLFHAEVALCAYMCGKYKQACQINDAILKTGRISHEGELNRIKKNDEFFRKAYAEYLKKGGKQKIKKVPNLPLGTRGINLNKQASEITPEKIEALRKVQEQLKDAVDVSVVVHVNTFRPNFEKLMLAIANQSVKPQQIYVIIGSKVTLDADLTRILVRFKKILPQLNPIKIQSNGIDYDGRLKFMNTVSAKYLAIYDDNRIPGPRNIEYYLKLAKNYPDIVEKGIFGQWGWQLHAPKYEDGVITSQWETHPHINQSRFLSNDQLCGDLKEVDYVCGHWFAPTKILYDLAKRHDTQEVKLEHWKEDILFSLETRLHDGVKTYKACPRDDYANLIFDMAEVQDHADPEELTKRSELIKEYCVKGYQMVINQPNGASIINTDQEKMVLESADQSQKMGQSLLEVNQVGQRLLRDLKKAHPQVAMKTKEAKEIKKVGFQDGGLFSVSPGLKKSHKPAGNVTGVINERGLGFDVSSSSPSQNKAVSFQEGGLFSISSGQKKTKKLSGPVSGGLAKVVPPKVVKKLDFSSGGLFAISDGFKPLIRKKTSPAHDVINIVVEVKGKTNQQGKDIKQITAINNMGNAEENVVRIFKNDVQIEGVKEVVDEASGKEMGVKEVKEMGVKEVKEVTKEVDEAKAEVKEVVEEVKQEESGDIKKFESKLSQRKNQRIAIYVPDYTSLGGSELTIKTLYDRLKHWCEKGHGKKYGHHVMITNIAIEAVKFKPDLIITQQRAVGMATQLCHKLKIRLWILLHGPRQFIPSPALEMLIFNSQQLLEFEQKDVPQNVKTMFYHPAIDLDRFRITDQHSNLQRKFITFVGSSSYNYLKGCDLFVELARSMPRDKFLYIGPVEKIDYKRPNYPLVGQMPELVGVKGGKNQYKPNKLPKNLQVRPNTPELAKIYQQSKVLVVPSIVESFGRVAVEASVAGVPVVCSALPGLKEATGGLANYVEKYREVGEFKKAVQEVLNWREEYVNKCDEIVKKYEVGVEKSFKELVGCL